MLTARVRPVASVPLPHLLMIKVKFLNEFCNKIVSAIGLYTMLCGVFLSDLTQANPLRAEDATMFGFVPKKQARLSFNSPDPKKRCVKKNALGQSFQSFVPIGVMPVRITIRLRSDKSLFHEHPVRSVRSISLARQPEPFVSANNSF